MTTKMATDAQSVLRITLRGRDVLAKVEDVDIAVLRFDGGNIRFKHVPHELSQEEMGTTLYEGMEGIEGSDELYRGIKENGGIVESLIVQYIDGKYIVREGNRRLACLKRLKREAHTIGIEGQPRDKFDKAPCAILPNDVTKEDLAIYLGHIHVVGKKDWPTYNKAWLVYSMDGGDMNLPYAEIAKHLGMSKATVQRMVQAYKYTKAYGEKFGDKDWLTKYSYFEEIYKGKKRLPSEYVVKDGPAEVLTDSFVNWFGSLVYEGNLGKRGENVRKLLKIFAKKDKAAIEAVEKKGIDDAWKTHALRYPEETSPIYSAIEEATVALDKITLMEFDALQKDDARIEKLRRLKTSIDRILQHTDRLQVKQTK